MIGKTMYYGQSAYEGFAKAFAKRLGVTVNIANGANAAVNAQGEITLPGMNGYQTQSEFEQTCATIIHEVSHVFYGSHSFFDQQVNDAKSQTPKVHVGLFRDCLNAVLDVADETGIGAYEISARQNYRAQELLVRSNTVTWNNRNGEWQDPKTPPHFAILCAGIIRARLNPCPATIKIMNRTTVGRVFEQKFPQVKVKEVYKALHKARLSDGRNRRRGSHWRVLSKAWEVYRLLEPVMPPDDYDGAGAGQGGQPMPGGLTDGAGQASGNPGSQGQSGGAVQGNASAVPSWAQEATEADGADMAQGGTRPQPSNAGGTSQTPTNSQQQGGGGAGSSTSQQRFHYTPTKSIQQEILPVIRRIADRIAVDGDSIDYLGGYYNGNGVKNVHRIFTDGACMGRWTENEHADGMALCVLLDVSGSMDHIMCDTMAVAEAFAKGMEDCASVQRFEFGDYVQQKNSFDGVNTLGGGTDTTGGIQKAHAWLKTQTAGKKVMVVVTDGGPNNSMTCQAAARAAQEDKILMVGVMLASDDAPLRRSMPNAVTMVAPDTLRLAMELETLAHRLDDCQV